MARVSPQRATQLVMVPQIDEACAPTDDSVNPLLNVGQPLLASGLGDSSAVDFIEDVSCAIEGTLDSELNSSQHVVANVGSLCSSDAEPGVLAKDLGVGHLRGFGENLQEMGLPLRV
jgi:hypothetical protein